jgi:hypothetical protein
MERGEFIPQANMAVNELIKRYQKEIVPRHKGASPNASRCSTIRQLLGNVRVAELTPAIPTSNQNHWWGDWDECVVRVYILHAR